MASRTQYAFVEGKFSYIFADRLDPKYGKYKVTVHPTDKGMEVVRDLVENKKIKNKLKKDDDGYSITFSRQASKKIKGELVSLGPIELLNGQMELPDGTFAPLRNTYVGDGSDGVLKLEVYPYKPVGEEEEQWAARPLSIRVDNLVPYVKKDALDKATFTAYKGMDEQPKQEWW